MKTITLVVPCFNEEDTIDIFYENVLKYFNNSYLFNIIFVDDGSKDGTRDIIKELANKDKKVKYVAFSRNFGKEAAMYAGLEAAKKLKTDAAIIMDVDMQDPPFLIKDFLKSYEDGFKIVYAKQKNKKGAKLPQKFFSMMFYKTYAFFTKDKELVNGTRDYCLLDKNVIDVFLSIKDKDRFIKGMYHYVGFKKKCIEFNYQKRVKGKSKWKFRSLLNYAFVGIKEFSRSYLVLVRLIILISVLFLIYDCIYESYFYFNSNSTINFYYIRLDIALLFVEIILYNLFKLVYDLRDHARNRPIYIEEETNVETE